MLITNNISNYLFLWPWAGCVEALPDGILQKQVLLVPGVLPDRVLARSAQSSVLYKGLFHSSVNEKRKSGQHQMTYLLIQNKSSRKSFPLILNAKTFLFSVMFYASVNSRIVNYQHSAFSKTFLNIIYVIKLDKEKKYLTCYEHKLPLGTRNTESSIAAELRPSSSLMEMTPFTGRSRA